MKRKLEVDSELIKKLRPIVDRQAVPVEDVLIEEVIHNQEVVKSFYQEIHQAQELCISPSLDTPPAIILLVARIAATSPTLQVVNMHSLHSLGSNEHAPKIAKALAASETIHTVDISGNFLREYGPETARNLAASKKIHTVNISNNFLREYGPETARNLAASEEIHTVDINGNFLGKNGSETARNLAASKKIHTVNISNNFLGKDSLETAKSLATSKKIHTVDISGNNRLHEYNQEIADIFRWSGEYITKLKEIIIGMGHDSQGDSFLLNDLVEIIGEYVGFNIEFTA